MVRVGLQETESQLAKLVKLAEQGEDVVIHRSGRPVARIAAVDRRRQIAEAFGSLRGHVELFDDFDELPPRFTSHFR